ncbi:MAG: 50S ribosomal protein L35 [Elusimicrobiales bacterium]|jgi:large subunit ribosomal protein L35|nr:50S ribosomal protein L35 [Elusimicrobiales bacterium]NLH39480.1 50S ribosomal protein L35 [Elusimicrobiota bacterium]
MPKMKNHAGAKKRIKITKNGKIKWKRVGLKHLLTPMSAKKGRALKKAKVIGPETTTAKLIKTYLPYK